MATTLVWSIIRIRFVTTGGFVSSVIRFVTNSLFSHVEFGTPEGNWIGALSDGGVQERPGNYCNPTREYVYEIPCTPEQAELLLKLARAKIGTNYNFLDIAGLLLHRRAFTSPHRLICSQFCTEILMEVLGPVLNVLPEWSYLITPEILHLMPIIVGCLVKKKG